MAGLVRDVEGLNLFMFVSEIVAALHGAEALAKLKNADMAATARDTAEWRQRSPARPRTKSNADGPRPSFACV